MSPRELIDRLQREGLYPELVDVLSAVEHRVASLEQLVERQAELIGDLRKTAAPPGKVRDVQRRPRAKGK